MKKNDMEVHISTVQANYHLQVPIGGLTFVSHGERGTEIMRRIDGPGEVYDRDGVVYEQVGFIRGITAPIEPHIIRKDEPGESASL